MTDLASHSNALKTALLAYLEADALLLTARDTRIGELEALVENLRGQLEALQPPEPPGPVDPWTIVDLTREPAGTAYGTGPTSTNAARYGRSQAAWGPSGLVVVGARDTAGVLRSADVQLRGVTLPPYFRVEVTAMCAPLTTGVWPCPLWFRPVSGEGEIDVVELYGREAGGSVMHMTVHRTPYDKVHHAQVARTAPLPNPGGEHTYGLEKVPDRITWSLDGRDVLTLTPGDVPWWASMFEIGTRWYPRVTLQLGEGTGSKFQGPLDAAWTGSVLNIRSLRYTSLPA